MSGQFAFQLELPVATEGGTVTAFSTLYLRPVAPQQDSQRFRLRMLGACGKHLDENAQKVVAARLLERSGARVPVYPNGAFVWAKFLEHGELRDVLDWITYSFDVLSKRPIGSAARFFLTAVQDALDAEHMAYAVDGTGVVHYRIDEAHESARQSALVTLNGARFRATRDEFERAYEYLAQREPDGKAAIRAIFGALENQFKLMFGVARLDTPSIRDGLKALIRVRHNSDDRAKESALRMAEELEKWVAAAHFYRHEPGVEEPGPPPIEIAVALVGTGTAHLRWLAGMDTFG